MVVATTVFPCLAVLVVGLLMRAGAAAVPAESCATSVALVLSGGGGIAAWFYISRGYSDRNFRLIPNAEKPTGKLWLAPIRRRQLVRWSVLVVLTAGTLWISHPQGLPSQFIHHAVGSLTPVCS